MHAEHNNRAEPSFVNAPPEIPQMGCFSLYRRRSRNNSCSEHTKAAQSPADDLAMVKGQTAVLQYRNLY